MEAQLRTGEARGLPLPLALTSLAFILLLASATWLIMARGLDELIEFKATKVAKVVSGTAAAARSTYTGLAVSKLARDGFGASETSDAQRGHVPLPAQFLKSMSQRSNEASEGVYSFRPISRWNLGTGQGLEDDFQRWAWAELERQDRRVPEGPVDWQPVWRIEDVDAVPTLRYLRADPASSDSCADCHNALEARPDIVARRLAAGETPGRRWARHELLGAIEVQVPLAASASLARSHAANGLLIIGAILSFGLLAVGVLFHVDRSRTRRMTRELARQAHRDVLTGLPNRLHFERELERMLSRSAESSTPHALMLLDLDEFKQINDTLGHEAGDTVLRISAQRLQEAIGAHGLVARLGGDEFAVLLPGATRERVEQLAEAIRARIDEAGIVDGHRFVCGVSIGIALVPEHADEPRELVRCADIAMYAAKRGRLTFALYSDEFDDHKVSHLAIIDDLRQAMQSGSLTLHFQPQYDLREGRMTGAEALLRWHHPLHGNVRPDHLVEIAERAGLIRGLSDWVLAEALRQCAHWRAEGFDLTVSVNLTASDLHDPALPERVAAALARSRLPASALVLEVTESSMVENLARAESTLDELVASGVTIAIDDYGTGYCSLSYLARLPIGELKLDRAFVSGLASGDKKSVIVDATIGLAHALGLSIVAEGVEDAHTLEYLVAHDCDAVQGYFLARPLAADELVRRLPFIHRFVPAPTLPRAA